MHTHWTTGSTSSFVDTTLTLDVACVVALSQNSIVTRDYRVDRVRVFVDDKNVVVKAPAQG